jgi:hypothetical protein
MMLLSHLYRDCARAHMCVGDASCQRNVYARACVVNSVFGTGRYSPRYCCQRRAPLAVSAAAVASPHHIETGLSDCRPGPAPLLLLLLAPRQLRKVELHIITNTNETFHYKLDEAAVHAFEASVTTLADLIHAFPSQGHAALKALPTRTLFVLFECRNTKTPPLTLVLDDLPADAVGGSPMSCRTEM